MTIIRKFKTARLTVVVTSEKEYDPDFSFDETGETARKVKSGEWKNFMVKAAVIYQGEEIATSYLGDCIYAKVADFQDHRLCGAGTRELRASGSLAVCGSYFADMVKEVCQEARQYLIDRRIYVRTPA